MKVSRVLFISLFVCNVLQASPVKKIVDVEFFQSLVAKVAHRQKRGNGFVVRRMIQDVQNHYSTIDAHECKRACMYVLLSEEKRRQETGYCQFDSQFNAIAFLAEYPIKTLYRPYVVAAQQIELQEKPWRSNWSTRYAFLRTYPKFK